MRYHGRHAGTAAQTSIIIGLEISDAAAATKTNKRVTACARGAVGRSVGRSVGWLGRIRGCDSVLNEAGSSFANLDRGRGDE